MAKVPLPDRGQPLDVTYLYQIANAVNDLSDSISTATYNYTTIETRNLGTQSIKNNNAKFYAAFEDIVTGDETVSANSTKDWTVNFDSNFDQPPIVTATAVNNSGTPSGNDVTVIIRTISTNAVTGVVRFNSSGSINISVNVIAIGFPA